MQQNVGVEPDLLFAATHIGRKEDSQLQQLQQQQQHEATTVSLLLQEFMLT